MIQPWRMNRLSALVAAVLLAALVQTVPARTLVILDSLGTQSSVEDVSNGNIVGYTPNALPLGTQGFLFNIENSSLLTLSHPNKRFTWPKSISGSRVAGYAADGYEGFYLNSDQWFTLRWPGSMSTEAYGLDGVNVVGQHFLITGPSNNIHGFLYNTQASSWTNLDFPGSSMTVALDVSGNNVVGYYYGPSGNDSHGFIYDIANANWTSVDFPGAVGTRITGIDGSNMIGEYSAESGNGAFFYDGIAWTALAGATPKGIDGNQIVGNLMNGEAFVYTGSFIGLDEVFAVPEPSTYALLLVTAAGVLWFTRKRRPIKVRALVPVVAVFFGAFTAPSLHAQLIEARAYWRGGGSVPGFLDGGGVAFDAGGNLFRTQINQDLTVAEGLILKITPDGVYTSIPFPYFQPYTLALTDTGNIYVGSWFNEVAKIAPDGSVTRMYTQGSAMGMAADANGNVWVGSVGRIHKITPNDQVEVFGTFFGDAANGMATDASGQLYFQTSKGGSFAALPDLAITPTTTMTGTDYLGNQTGFTFRGSVSPHPLVPNANSGDVGQRAFYTVPEPSTYALLLMTAVGVLWFTRKRRPIKVRALVPVVAVLFAAVTLSIQPSAQADTFGTSGNEFTIDFVNIGNTGNAADTTGYGAVPYEYRASTYEISQDAITKATASGMANVTAGAWTGNQPAANIQWYEAAAFVNFLNTNSGKTAAYALTFSNRQWSMALWSSEQAWTAGGTNLYRNKDAFYFLPSENEWYKAAYFNPAGSNYFLYPTASSTAPTAVASGTNAGSAVYNSFASSPALVNRAGGLSPLFTMGQGGNVWEWNESAYAGTNSSSTEARVTRGGASTSTESNLRSSERYGLDPANEGLQNGFRVASVPEPSTYALLLMTAAGALWMTRRRR
jgi:hypothetical protein